MQWPGVASVQASAGGGAAQCSTVQSCCGLGTGAGAMLVLVQHCCPGVLCCVTELHLIAGGVWVLYSEVLVQLRLGAVIKCYASEVLM